MRPQLITPPEVSAITLEEAKHNLRVDHNQDDIRIQGIIDAVVDYYDGWDGILHRALEPQTWEMYLDSFPLHEIYIPLGPVVNVVSVNYFMEGDINEQVVPPDQYLVDITSVDSWIIPIVGYSWPTTREVANAVRVQWVAGTGTPDAVKQSIHLMVAHLYENREATIAGSINELPLGAMALVGPKRRVYL